MQKEKWHWYKEGYWEETDEYKLELKQFLIKIYKQFWL